MNNMTNRVILFIALFSFPFSISPLHIMRTRLQSQAGTKRIDLQNGIYKFKQYYIPKRNMMAAIGALFGGGTAATGGGVAAGTAAGTVASTSTLMTAGAVTGAVIGSAISNNPTPSLKIEQTNTTSSSNSVKTTAAKATAPQIPTAPITNVPSTSLINKNTALAGASTVIANSKTTAPSITATQSNVASDVSITAAGGAVTISTTATASGLGGFFGALFGAIAPVAPGRLQLLLRKIVLLGPIKSLSNLLQISVILHGRLLN